MDVWRVECQLKCCPRVTIHGSSVSYWVDPGQRPVTSFGNRDQQCVGEMHILTSVYQPLPLMDARICIYRHTYGNYCPGCPHCNG